MNYFEKNNLTYLKNNLKKVFGLLFLVCSSIAMQAKVLPTIPSAVITNPANGYMFATIADSRFTDYSDPLNFWYNSFNNVSVKNIVRVKIDRTNHKYIANHGTITVNLEVDYYTFTPGVVGTTHPTPATYQVVLNYDTSLLAKETDEAVIVIDKAVKSTLKVVSVVYSNTTGNTYAAQNPDITIQNTIEIERISALTSPSILSYWYTTSGTNVNGRDQFLTMNWPIWSGAEFYELEYLFINNPNQVNGFPATSPTNLANYPYNFRHNCTRVIVTDPEFKIPNLFPDGYLVFRVRAVSYDLVYTHEPVYGAWSHNESGNINLNLVTPGSYFENAFQTTSPHPNLNWSTNTVFAEEGKTGISITYFDGTLRAREGVAYNNSTNTYTVSQTILDYQGREALVAMPSVALDNYGFAYRAGFNKNNDPTPQPYSYLDFDLNKTGSDEITVKPMSESSGANLYYSSGLLSSAQYNALDASAKRMHTFIPKADGYAFSQVEFTRDPSGRTWRQGGVGRKHQLKAFNSSGSWLDGKQTLTWDGTPTQEELFVLFGNEVGEATKYKKVMTQDPNGQVSVAYIDPYGRTIATALAGDSANTPNLDALASSQHKLSFTSVLRNTWEDKFEGVRVLNQEILVTNDGYWNFDYSYPKPKFSLCDNNLCIECAYDITLSITNPNDYNKEMLPGGQPINIFVGQPVGDTAFCSENQLFQYEPDPIQVFLTKGSYRISKTFKINTRYKDSLKEQWLAGSACVKSFADFLTEEKEKLGNDCNVTCEDCQESIAALTHVADSIKTWCIEHSVNFETDNAYLAAKTQLNEVSSFCAEACNVQTPCETLYDAILMDLQPGGQYAKFQNASYDGVSGDLASVNESTIFKTGNNEPWHCMNSNGGNPIPIWKLPHTTTLQASPLTLGDYLNEDGSIAYIPISEINGIELPEYTASEMVNGVKCVKPKNLTHVEDFIHYYQDNLHWAKNLAKYHPEYCYYENCKAIEPIYAYDQIILSVSRAKNAIEMGFYNPLNMNVTGELGQISGNNINYNSLEVTSDIRRDVILNQSTSGNPINHINPYTQTQLFLANGTTPWALPSGLSLTGTSGLKHLLTHVPVKDASCSTVVEKTIWEIMEEQRLSYSLSSFDSCVEDLFWPLLRSLYLQQRNAWLNSWYESQCAGSCQYTLDRIKMPRWRKTGINDMLADQTANPWYTPSIWANLENNCDPVSIGSAIDAQVEDYCDNQCEANAELWMQKLENCYATNAYLNSLTPTAKTNVLNDIKAAFKNLCMGGCDIKNAYGSKTVNPARLDEMDSNNDPLFPHKNIEAVLKAYLTNPSNPAAGWFSAGICDDLLIDFPGNYGHDYLAYNGPGMDTCGCKANKNIRSGITDRCPPLGHDSLIENDCSCNKDKALRYPLQSVHSIDIDKKCQNCITCKELDAPVYEFLNRYDVAQMADTILSQQLLENWLNNSFGFNLNYSEYWAFATGCVDTNSLKIRPWYKIWEHIGLNRLVADNTNIKYHIPLFDSNTQTASQEQWVLLYPQSQTQYWASAENSNTVYAPVPAPFAITTTDNVECNCRKVLAAAKLAEDKPADFPGGGAIAFQKLYNSPYPANGGFSFEDVKNKCCELFNTGNTPPKDCPKAFEIGQPFSTAARQEIANQLGNNNITDALFDINCTPDQEVPCMKDLDTCGCNKLQTEYAAWMAHPVYKPSGTAPVSFEVFLKINTGLTISNATELKDKCFELFMKGVAKDKNGNAVRGYVPGNPSGWWSKSAQSNLKQEVQDKKISDHMIIPADWSCNPGCTEPLPPCTKRLSPCMLKFVFSAFIANEWFKEISGQPRYEAMGVGTFSEVDEYMGTVLEWTDQYDTYLSNNTTPTDPTDAARVAMLQLLFDQLKGYYLENTCPEDRVSPVTLEFLMKKMLGCGNGNVIVENPCTVSMTCADFGAVLQTLLINHNWPGFSGSSYSNAGDYAVEFEYWYYTYLAKKANNTHTQGEADWADAVLNQLNAEYNSCYPTTLLEMKDFIKRIWNCRPLPRPAGTQASPCPSCYAPNMEWLEALQTFINDVNKKQKPNRLTDYSFYLKPNSGLQTVYYLTSFYNSILYQNGTDQENLTWNLNEDYQGGKLMPGMRTLIKDNNGFKLDMSLDWPTEEARWNFNYIQNFINIRPIKTKGCGQPKYFYVDVVYKVPVDYVQPGNAFGYVNNYPQPFVEYCLDTVTLIGKIWESSNGLNVSKQVPCLGCNKLCNRPIATLAVKAEDPCEEDKKVAIYNATLRFNAHIQARAAYFDSMYRNTCFGAQDRLEAEYDLNQYYYTLYYYDQAGQLIKTVPPAGVDIDNNQLSNADRQLLANDRIATAWAHMNNNSIPRANMYHGLITNYKYYTGGQLAWQHTPDGGESRFWYDNLGRIVLSQNANQKDEGTYSFTEFDALGRPKMAGELDPSSATYLVDDYHIGFEDGQEGYSFNSQEDGISITRPSGKPDFKFFYTPGSYNKRLKIATNTASAAPECHISGFVLSPVQTYTLSFFGELKGTLSQFNYQIKDNVSTYVNTSFTGGPHSVSHNINLASGSNGQLEIIFTSTSSGSTEYFEIDDIRITHSETAIPAASPRRAAQNSWLADFRNTGTKTQVVQTWFAAIPTAASAEFTGLLNNGQGYNLRSRVAFTTNEDVYDGNDATYTHGTAYSYDIHGNAERIVQNIPSLKHLGVNLYTLDYDYDLISGKVNQVEYQTGKKDQWMHRYEYDADNRLVRAYTSRDGYIWERDAKYFYYLHGPLGRTELGELQVQGIDNTYTLHGWIKGVNSPSMTPENDIGQDGFVPSTGTNANQFVGRDAFAYYLSYYNQDYTNLAGQEFEPQKAASNLSTRYRELYNGNIAHMGTLLPTIKGTNSWAGNNTKMSRVLTPSIMGNVYHYDQLNRITKHFVFDNYTAPSGSGTGSWQNSSPAQMGDGKFYESFAYDPNGNITRLARNAATAPAAGGTTGQIGTGPTMDNMSYRYDQRNQTIVLQQNTMVSVSINMPYTNKLYLVDDEIHQNAYLGDIDDQGAYNSSISTMNTANNYGYDKLGNLIRDNAEEIASIQWNVTGKIQRITRSTGSKKADLVYGYDASGTRLFKVVIPKQQNGASTGTRMSQEHWDTAWYIKDVSGNAMATYKTTHTRIYTTQPQNSTLKKQFFTEELYIYGSNRHGVLKANDMLSEKEYALSLGQYIVPDSTFPQAQEGVFETIGSTQTITVNYTQGQFTFARGNKQYELSNHLGNVLVTIQDRKWGIQTTAGNTANYYLPYIVTTTDYYAFGSSMVERSQSFGEIYKFGMNTQEKETELGDGVTSAEFWMYDGKLGRRWNVDPLDQVRLSNYSVNGNNPIINLDIKGDYFFGLIGSTKKQRDAARQMASAHNGEIKNITTNNIHVLWTNTITENNFSYRPGTAYILTEKIVNRKTSFLKDGDAITQRLKGGIWESIIYQGEDNNWEKLNKSGFVGELSYGVVNSGYLTAQMFWKQNPQNIDGTFANTNERVLGFITTASFFVPTPKAIPGNSIIDDIAKAGGSLADDAAKGVTNAVTRSESVLGHIFRNAPGHVNPSTVASQNRYIKLFESVANNPANLNQSILAPNAIKNGVQGFTQTFKNGQIWVHTRNGKIFDAGVNLIPR